MLFLGSEKNNSFAGFFLLFLLLVSSIVVADAGITKTQCANKDSATCKPQTTTTDDNNNDERVQTILQDAGFAQSDIDTVLDGKLHKKILDSSNSREIGMAFAVVLPHTTPDDIAELFISQRLKTVVDPGIMGIGIIGKNKKKGTRDDFKKFTLFPGKSRNKEKYVNVILGRLLQESPGDDLNLSKGEIKALHEHQRAKDEDSSSNNNILLHKIDQTIRESLWKRYQSYQQKSLNGILPYARKNGNEYHPGNDMTLSSKMTNILKREAPVFFKHLKHFPKDRPDDLQESFSWITFENPNSRDGIPNVELVHRMGRKQPDKGSFVFSERQYFALHSYNCVHGEGGAIPIHVSGNSPQTLLVFSSRTSTDAVTGFGGSAKRSIGVRMMGNMVADVLEQVRTILEKQQKK